MSAEPSSPESPQLFSFNPQAFSNELDKSAAIAAAIGKLPPPLQEFFAPDGEFAETCDEMFNDLDTRFTMSLDHEQLLAGLTQITKDLGLSVVPSSEDAKVAQQSKDEC